MTFDPRQIRAFAAVVEHGTIGRAAEHLNMTQPALSRIIKRFEMRLNVPLFERHSKGVDLTEYGQALLPYAVNLETESLEALNRIDMLRGNGGILRVGAVGSVAVDQLPKAIKKVHNKFPSLLIKVKQGVQDVIMDMLCNNQIDIAIADQAPEFEDVIKLHTLALLDTHAVVASPLHPLSQQGNVTLQEVSQANWVMPDQTALPRRQFEQIFEEFGTGIPNIIIECNSPSTMKAVASETMLLAWLPSSMVQTEIAGEKLRGLDVEELKTQRKLRAYGRRRGYITPQIRFFLNSLFDS